MVITDITCNDNETDLDADDDTYSFNMTVVGTNASAQWEGGFSNPYVGAFAFGPTNYGEVIPLEGWSAGDFIPTNISPPTVVSGGQDVEIFVNDVANPNCSTSIIVSSTGTCSQVAVPTCNITGSFIVTDGCLTDQFTVLVDANDPYNPPNNTRYSYEYDIASDNTITGINTNDPRSLNIRYGTPGIKTITATLRENATPACKQTFTTSFNVIDCNVSECLVVMDITNILCSDAGTPYDESDDTYTFNVEVIRTGGTDDSGGYNLDISNGNLGAFLLPGNYGDIHLVGPFPVGFDIDLVARTNGTPSCADFQTVTSPPACSNQEECSIGFDVTNIKCNDNGTPSNASDDFFTFNLFVFRTGGTGGNGWIANYDNANLGAFIETGAYNELILVGPFPVGNDINITVSSDGTPSCSASSVAVSPAACSNAPACAIAGTFSVADGCLNDEYRLFVDANDPYNPPNNPRYIYDYNLNSDNTIAGISSTDPRSVNVTYSTPGTKTITATVTDRNDPTCVLTLTSSFVVRDCGIEGPETCLVDIDISNTVCQDNGTFTFDLAVFRTGGTPGASWEGTLGTGDTGIPITGAYNERITMGPFTVLEQDMTNPLNSFRRTVRIAVNAAGIPTCDDYVEVLAPESCSNTTTGGVNYCANISVVGGPGQIVINGVEAPNHRIQYRLFPTTPYTDICVNNCYASQLIYGLSANTYYIRVEQSSAGGGDYCEQEFTVGVSRSLAESSSRAAAFTDFNAYKEARQIDLEWLTNTTYKSDYFLVEKSIDGLTFETLASVDNEPVGLDVGYFQSIDPTPTMGDNYYRLKQVYQDGTFAYSEVRHIRFGIDLTSMDLFPNPAKQELYVNLKEFEGKEASVLIANQYGTVVEEYQVAAISNEPMRIDLATYSNGLYFIRTKISKTKIITKKFLVNKLY